MTDPAQRDASVKIQHKVQMQMFSLKLPNCLGGKLNWAQKLLAGTPQDLHYILYFDYTNLLSFQISSKLVYEIFGQEFVLTMPPNLYLTDTE